jgi:hypothetical protein
MTEWLTYSASDFIPFSRGIYRRLFELYNARYWPAVAIGLGVGLAALRLCGGRGCSRPGLLLAAFGCCWIWIAWAFFSAAYAELNWAGPYVGGAFALNGLLLLAASASARPRPPSTGRDIGDPIGYGLLVAGVVLWPAALLAFGRDWRGLELFGTSPEPTVLATFGLLLLLRPRGVWAPALIPGLWSLLAAVTLRVIDEPLWPVLPAGAAAFVAVLVSRALRRRRSTRIETNS